MDDPLNLPGQEIPLPDPPPLAPSPRSQEDAPFEIRRHSDPLPNPSLPAYPRITPRSFGVEFEPRQFRAAATAEEEKPLTLKAGTAADKVQVIPGYVNSLMPTLSATALDAGTPPEITVTADVWVWIKCVGTFGTGGSGEDEYTVTIETSASAVTPAGTAISDTGFTSFRAIGKVDYTAGSPATYVITNFHNGGNLGVDSFGNVNLWWLA